MDELDDVGQRYVLVARADRSSSRARIGHEWQTDPAHVAVWGKPAGEVIAAGTYEACIAAGRLLLEET